MIVYVMLIVQRSKYVLDFVLTAHGLFLVGVVVYNKAFPLSPLWWLVQVGQCVIEVVGGRWGCGQREVREMVRVIFGWLKCCKATADDVWYADDDAV